MFVTSLVMSVALALPMAGPKSAEPTLKVGDRAPALQLASHDGQTLSLAQLCDGNDYVALVFIRSANW